jgi:hypothetical protein
MQKRSAVLCTLCLALVACLALAAVIPLVVVGPCLLYNILR